MGIKRLKREFLIDIYEEEKETTNKYIHGPVGLNEEDDESESDDEIEDEEHIKELIDKYNKDHQLNDAPEE